MLLALVAASLALCPTSCKGEVSIPPAQSSSASVPGPVDEPKNLAATFAIRDPDLVLAAARQVLGARAGLLASRDRLATLLVDLGLPASTLDAYSPVEPVVGAVTEGDKPDSALSLAVAIAVTDSARFHTLTTFGASPAFEARRDAASGGEVLTPAAGQVLPFSLGVFGNHLVIASDEGAVLAMGPFLDQIVAPRFKSSPATGRVTVEVEGSALAHALDSRLAAWGAALPLDSKLFLDPTTLLIVLREAGKLTFEATIEPDRVGLSVVGSLPVAAARLGLGRGPIAEALGAPSGSQAAITLFEDADSRRASAQAARTVIGAVFEKEDSAAFGEALTELATARADRSTLGFELGARGPALFGELSLSDPDVADRALAKLVEAVEKKSVSASLARVGFSFGAKKTVMERVGEVTRLRVARLRAATKREESSDDPPGIDLFLRRDRQKLLLGAGYDAQSALLRALGDGKLATEPRVRAAMARAPGTVSLALFLDPAALAHPRARTSSVALITVDVDPDERKLRAMLELDTAALAALLDLAQARHDHP